MPPLAISSYVWVWGFVALSATWFALSSDALALGLSIVVVAGGIGAGLISAWLGRLVILELIAA